MKKLECWKQEVKFNWLIRKGLATSHGTLFPVCHLSLRIRLEAEPEYQEMITDEIEDAMKLHELVKKNIPNQLVW